MSVVKINIPSVLLRMFFIFLNCVIILLFLNNVNAQPENPPFPTYTSPTNQPQYPPRPILLNPIQNLNFGAFYQGVSGGTVDVNQYGVRTSSGDIVLLDLGFFYFPAIFEINANSGTIISILNGPDVDLSDGNGHTINLHISSSYPNSPFVTIEALTNIYIGGTITVGGSLVDPPGNYSGTFLITFIQE